MFWLIQISIGSTNYKKYVIKKYFYKYVLTAAKMENNFTDLFELIKIAKIHLKSLVLTKRKKSI